MPIACLPLASSQIDELDYERRMAAYSRLIPAAWQPLTLRQAAPLLHTCLHDLRNAGGFCAASRPPGTDGVIWRSGRLLLPMQERCTFMRQTDPTWCASCINMPYNPAPQTTWHCATPPARPCLASSRALRPPRRQPRLQVHPRRQLPRREAACCLRPSGCCSRSSSAACRPQTWPCAR